MAPFVLNIARLQKAITWLTGPHLLFWALPWLMVLLIAGTVAQKYVGLYVAQKIFFTGPILWLGFVPLPGLPLTLAAITVSLTAKFFLSSPWQKSRLGINLAHLGVLLLLIGGIVTAVTQKEGFLLIPEGAESNRVQDYHDRLVTLSKGKDTLAQAPLETLDAGDVLSVPGHNLHIRIDKTCRNCMPAMVENARGRHGRAEKVTINPAQPEKEDEQNLSGLEIAATGGGQTTDGVYVLMERMSPAVEIGAYTLSIGRRETTLPFTLRLDRFEREFHPGTMDARAFRARLTVIDGKTPWPVTVSMNEPLRYKGYTLYQSSFIEDPNGLQTVLNVVQNRGRIFPYLSGVIIFAGLLIHLVVRLRQKRETT